MKLQTFLIKNQSKIIIHKDFIGDDVSMVRYLSENLLELDIIWAQQKWD